MVEMQKFRNFLKIWRMKPGRPGSAQAKPTTVLSVACGVVVGGAFTYFWNSWNFDRVTCSAAEPPQRSSTCACTETPSTGISSNCMEVESAYPDSSTSSAIIQSLELLLREKVNAENDRSQLTAVFLQACSTSGCHLCLLYRKLPVLIVDLIFVRFLFIAHFCTDVHCAHRPTNSWSLLFAVYRKLSYQFE